jgi:multidrug efflux system outer membrane protein
LLAACAVGPDYQSPDLHYSDQWNAQSPQDTQTAFIYPGSGQTASGDQKNTATDLIQTDWWRIFNDPQLEKYIDLAILENHDLRAARARVDQARGLRQEIEALFYPQVDAAASGLRQGTSRTTGSAGSRRTIYSAGLDASWEIDLFGGIQRENQAEQARLELAMEERRAVLLSVLAETARSYYAIRGIQKRIAIIHANIELQRNTFELIENLFQMGEATEFDLSRAKGQLELTQARLPDLDADLKTAIFQLSVLIGQPPEALLSELLAAKPLPAPPDMVPLGLRSEILRRRPDIRQAERELAAATADIGVAVADLYPSFSLTGNIGRSASVFSDLFDSASNVFSIGPILRWPIFQGGAIRANIKVQEAEAQEAAIRYEQAVLNSLADVESALTRYAQKLLTRDSLRNAMISSERSTELARVLFNSGEENFLSVLDAERELTSVKDELVISETDTILNLIALYTALGGGWEVFEKQELEIIKTTGQ